MKELLYYCITHNSNLGWPAIRSALNPFYGDQVGMVARIASVWQQLLPEAEAKKFQIASSAMQQTQQVQAQLQNAVSLLFLLLALYF